MANEIFCFITNIKVSKAAVKHPQLISGGELAKNEIRDLAEQIIFNRRQGEPFPIDSKYSLCGSLELTILSQTVAGFREWGINLSGNIATIHHYLEHNDPKRHSGKLQELKSNTVNYLTFSYDPTNVHL